MPASFDFPERTRLWVPAKFPDGGPSVLALAARLRPAFGLAQAQDDLDRVTNVMEEEFPAAKGWWGSRAVPVRDQVLGDTRPVVLALLGALALVLLIACANAANILLTRSMSRRKDLAVRRALGADRKRIAGHLVTESVLLALAGGLLGMILAAGLVEVVKAFPASGLPRLDGVEVDGRSLAFAVAVSMLTGVAIGLVPAWSIGRGGLSGILRQGGRGAGRAGSPRVFRTAMVVTQIALSLTLLAGAGLLVRSFAQLMAVDPGFRASNTVALELTLPEAGYPDRASVVRFVGQATERMGAATGVEVAAAGKPLPLDGQQEGSVFLTEDMPDPGPGESYPVSEYTVASPGFFRALGIPVRQGRTFRETDRADTRQVVVVSESFAERFWPGESAVGKRLRLPATGRPWRTVVGVVSDVRRYSLRAEPRPEMYVPYTQDPYPSLRTMQFVVRTAAGDPLAAVPALRRALARLDASVPLAEVRALEDMVAAATARTRLATALMGAFAGVALLLALVGLYGVIAVTVGERMREMGLRMALGASTGSVRWLVLRQALGWFAPGIVLGLAGALALGNALKSLLFGVPVADPLSMMATSVLMLAVGLFAAWIPARRATKVDPGRSLRAE